MANVWIIGRGSFKKQIRDTCEFNKSGKIDTLINYGAQASLAEKFTKIDGKLKDDTKFINCFLFPTKYDVCRVMVFIIPTPQSYNGYSAPSSIMDGVWILKPYRSFGGKDIVVWDGQSFDAGKYYIQQRITNRRYELRVHAFDWVPLEKWVVQKRIHPAGEEMLTWNHHTGGTFITIDNAESNTGIFKRAKENAKKVFQNTSYKFGAIDFIVSNNDNPLVPWFIEINSAPGITLPQVMQYYCESFSLLK